MRSDQFILYLNDFSKNIQNNIANVILDNSDIGISELKENWSNSQNIEGKLFKGDPWKSNFYRLKKSPYTSKNGRKFKFWYPTYIGTYDKLDLTGDFREAVTISRSNVTGNVEASSKVIYSSDIEENMNQNRVNIFSFRNSKQLMPKVRQDLVKKFLNG